MRPLASSRVSGGDGAVRSATSASGGTILTAAVTATRDCPSSSVSVRRGSNRWSTTAAGRLSIMVDLAHRTTDQKVGSSNLFGRARFEPPERRRRDWAVSIFWVRTGFVPSGEPADYDASAINAIGSTNVHQVHVNRGDEGALVRVLLGAIRRPGFRGGAWHGGRRWSVERRLVPSAVAAHGALASRRSGAGRPFPVPGR